MAATAAQDRFFLLSLGVGACVIVSLMKRMLVQYRNVAIIPQSEAKPQYITQDVEDSLKLGTLDKLLDSTSYSIRETTSVIICERALHDGTTIDMLLDYITQPDYDTREKGIRALTMLMNSSTVGLVNVPKTYAALVKCLEYCVTDYEHNEYDPEWDNWYFRDVIEKECLLVLGQLTDKYGIETLLKTSFVECWVAQEPWGGVSEDHRRYNFLQSMTKRLRLTNLYLNIYQHPKGKQQLERAKLIPVTTRTSQEPTTNDTEMNDEETSAEEDNNDLATDSDPATESEPATDSRRRRAQSLEGEHIRRRNREAMVLNDGTRPLGRGDIFQRTR